MRIATRSPLIEGAVLYRGVMMRQGEIAPAPRALSLLLVLAMVLPAILPSAARGQDRLTADDIEVLIELKVDEAEIVRKIQATKLLIFTDDDVARLKKAGASPQLVQEIETRLRGGGGGLVATVGSMLRRGAPEAEVIGYILSQPLLVEVPVDDLLRLRNAGATRDILLALQGRYELPGHRIYRDPLRLFSIQYPSDWQAYDWFTSSGLVVLLSPERGVQGRDQFKVGLQIQISVAPEGSMERRLGVAEYHRRTLQAWLSTNRRFDAQILPDPAGRATEMRFSGHDAIQQRVAVTMLGTRCSEKMVRCLAEDVSFYLEFVAPADQFEKEHLPVFDKMLATFRPLPERKQLVRQDQPADRTAVLQRSIESVVFIVSRFDNTVGTGSGVIVREDGLVLTNHHVVHDSAGKPARDITVLWDSSVGPKREGESHRQAPATLIDAVRERSPMTDLALLRLPRPPADKPYRPLPLCPVSNGLVKEEDEIIALGFPEPQSFGEPGRLITTNGHISRINHLPGFGPADKGPKRLDDLVMDISINSGNSGGPCIDLRTSAVIGINTAVPLARGHDGKPVKLDYGFLCLSDHALYHFPQLRWYPRDRKIGAAEHLELAGMLLGAGNYRAAGVELQAALPDIGDLDQAQQAMLQYRQAVFYSRVGDESRVESCLKEALVLDERCRDALCDLAYRHAYRAEFDKAVPLIDRLLKQEPDFWHAHYIAADVYRMAKRYPDALVSLGSALAAGGGFDSSTQRLKGQIHQALKEYTEAEAAFREALNCNPLDHDTGVALARLYEERDDLTAAQIEFGRLLRDREREPVVHAEYAAWLERRKQPEKSIEHWVAAIRLSREQGQKPPAGYYTSLCRVTLDSSDRNVQALTLAGALGLYLDHQGSRKLAVQWLGAFWTWQKRIELAQAHSYLETDKAERRNLIPPPLGADDLEQMAKAGYPAALVEEILTDCPLNLELNRERLERLVQSGWEAPELEILVTRYLLDQLQGSRGLADLIQLKWGDAPLVFDETGSYAWCTLTNRGKVPLTGLQVNMTYHDKSNKVLWTDRCALNAYWMPLDPGQSRSGRFRCHSWKELAIHGVTQKNFGQVTMQVTQARSAAFLDQIRAVGVRGENGRVHFALHNAGPFVVKGVRVRCDYTDKQNKPVIHGTTQTPIFDAKTFDRMALLPETRSVELTVPGWSSESYVKTLGMPPNIEWYAAPRIVDAELTLPGGQP